MDDFVLNVRQVASFPLKANAAPTDAILLQTGGVGGAYAYTTPEGLAGPVADQRFKPLQDTVTTLQSLQTQTVQSISDLQQTVKDQIQLVVDHSVWTFNGRRGDIWFTLADLVEAGGASIQSPNFLGEPTVKGDPVATVNWVTKQITQETADLLSGHPFVFAFNGRIGDVCLSVSDTDAIFLKGQPRTSTPPAWDHSLRIANTRWVTRAIEDESGFLHDHITDEISRIYAPIRSPNFKGIPTAPEPSATSDDNQIATTEWVRQVLLAIGAGVLTFQGRSGYVDLELADVTGVGGAPILSPAFQGTPTAITPPFTDVSTRLATTAFVKHWWDNSVTSFNTRIGDITLTIADIIGAGGQPVTKINAAVPTALVNGEQWFDSTHQVLKMWDGTTWTLPRAAAVVGDVAPLNPYQGMIWFAADDAEMYVWYENGVSDQWVVANVGSGTMGEQGVPGPIGPMGPQGNPGSSITIQGTLNDPSELPPTGNAGDAWIIGGDLYVWSMATNAWEAVPLNLSTDDGTF